MISLIKKIERKCKLLLLFWVRIIFAKNHFKVPFWRKLALNFRGGYVADQYVIYDLQHQNKKDYLSEFDWYKSRYINEPFDGMLNNKLVCADIFKHTIDVPPTLFVKNKKNLSNYQSDDHTLVAFLDEVKKHRRVFVKPISLGKGNGVHLLEYSNHQFYQDRQGISSDRIIEQLNRSQNWFATPSIEQAAYLDDIYDKTSNTIRIITVKDSATKRFKVIFAIQRIGVKASIPVDNGSRGGLISKIDLETGELSVAKSIQALGEHSFHPDSKQPIAGVIIPNWQKIMEEVLAVSNQFPYLNFIGWDILPNKQGGISMVEANTSSGVNIIQIWGPQRYGELGDFYRDHSVIK